MLFKKLWLLKKENYIQILKITINRISEISKLIIKLINKHKELGEMLAKNNGENYFPYKDPYNNNYKNIH